VHARTLSLVLALAAVGCASTEPQAVSATTATCERGYRVGSNIPVRDCAAPTTDEERERTVNDLRNVPRPTTSKSTSGG
jgi:hypothetical protein